MRWLCALGVLSALALSQNPAAPENLVLEDQFRQKQDLTTLRGSVVVVIYSDRDGADASRTLGERLFLNYHPTARGLTPAQAAREPVTPLPDGPGPDVVTVPVAELGAVPGPLRNWVRSEFAKGSPELSVWLDWKDDLKTRFGLAGGVPNVLLIDAQGRLRQRGVGVPNAAQFEKMTGTIDRLRREARPR